jgi:biopolymer transport protein ExbB
MQLTAAVLLLLSILSWYLILDKIAGLLRSGIAQNALGEFWAVDGTVNAIATLRRTDRSSAYADLAEAGMSAVRAVAGAGARPGVLDTNEYIKQSLAQSMLQAQARMERGLTFLASVGATAPFIGLFGTVWGIYHALVALSGATQVVLEKVAGPVGEALIMTAAGLFVAIPAVLAYNALVRVNRMQLARLEAFAHNLHAYFAAGIKPQTQVPASIPVPATTACNAGI